MRFIVLFSMLTACGPADVAEAPPPTPIPATLTTCETPDPADPTETDEQCVVLQLGCCDHCNGGRAVAVRADAADDVQATYVESCTPGTACTEMGCAPLTAECIEDRCVTVQGEL